jgi:queuine/archaeosine tRNA-ribosyltransferase
MRVWFDEYELRLGDRLLASIDHGLSRSRYGVVVLSPRFFSKDWPASELNALAERERGGRKVILPVWLEVSREQVAEYSPTLASRLAAKASDGIRLVADKICQVVLAPKDTSLLACTTTSSRAQIIKESPLSSFPARQSRIGVAGASMSIPAFYPSVSSARTRLPPDQCMLLLARGIYPTMLVSAYDLLHANQTTRNSMKRALDLAKKNGVSIALDSGNYEAFWKNDREWKRQDFWSILKGLSAFDLAFSFDGNPDSMVKTSRRSVPLVVNHIENSFLNDQERGGRATIIPIVHASQDTLEEVCQRVVERLNPLTIAIPERELGQGLLERARRVRRVRTALDCTGQYYPIHLLGTGDPWAILAYSAMGADSFDGLEWCLSVADPQTGSMHHFQQRECLSCDCVYCLDPTLDYTAATLSHNLLYYRGLMTDVQQSIRSGSLQALLDSRLPRRLAERLQAEVG